MRRLLQVELTRLRWRRAVVLLLAAVVALPVLVAVVTLLQTDLPSEDVMAEGERLAAEAVAQCVADPETFFGELPPGEDVRQLCEENNQPEYFVDTYSQLDLARERTEGGGIGVAVIVGLLTMLAGTTFVGHDWNTGSMGNQLLFVPRRVRVWFAKAGAIGAVSLAAAAVGTTAFWLLLAARFWTGGADLPDGVLLDGLQQGWRASGVAAAAGVAGYAITMLSRSTVFTLGLLFGVSVAGSIIIGVFVDDRGWVDPTVNISAVIQDGTSYYVEIPESCYDGREDFSGPCDSERDRSLAQGVIYLGVLGAAIVTGSTLSFRRRDVP